MRNVFSKCWTFSWQRHLVSSVISKCQTSTKSPKNCKEHHESYKALGHDPSPPSSPSPRGWGCPCWWCRAWPASTPSPPPPGCSSTSATASSPSTSRTSGPAARRTSPLLKTSDTATSKMQTRTGPFSRSKRMSFSWNRLVFSLLTKGLQLEVRAWRASRLVINEYLDKIYFKLDNLFCSLSIMTTNVFDKCFTDLALQVIPDYFAATVLQRSSPEYPQVCLLTSSLQVGQTHFETGQISAGFWKPQVPSCLQPRCHLDDRLHLPQQRCKSKNFWNLLFWWIWWHWLSTLRLALLRQGCLCFWDPPHHWLRRICLQDSRSFSPGPLLWLSSYLHMICICS